MSEWQHLPIPQICKFCESKVKSHSWKSLWERIVPVNSFTYVQRIDWFSRSEKQKHCNFVKLLLHKAFIPYVYRNKKTTLYMSSY